MDTGMAPNEELTSREQNSGERTKVKFNRTANTQFWLEQISLGNHSHFWNLWIHYRDDLHRYCLRWMGNNPIDAEEVLSRAMLLAWEKLKKYASKITNLKAWLTRLTHNLCIDVWRKRKKEVNVAVLEPILSQQNGALTSIVDGPDVSLLWRESEAAVSRAIAALPERLLHPFVLRFYQDWSYEAIATHLSITNATARKRIQQAREILKQQLNQYFAGETIALPFKSVITI